MVFCCLPYGALALTLIYGIFCYVMIDFGPPCPYEECRTEGVDNAPIAWASDFFVAITFLLLGIHTIYHQGGGMSKSFVAFLSWSIAYLFWGIVAKQFGNDGSNDSKGMRGYFILNLLGYVFSMESIMEVAGLTMLMWGTILPSYRPTCCGRSPLRTFEVLVTLTFLVIASGSLWCSVVPDVWAPDVYDEYPNDVPYSDIDTCIKMVDIGQVVFTAASALFWISVASIYGSSARQQIEQDDQWYFVGGIPTSLAAAAVICFQTMIFTFHLLAFVMQQRAGENPDEEVATTATIAYHYSILMTGYFAHNFLATMSLSSNDSVQKPFDEDEESGSIMDPNAIAREREFIKKVRIIQSSDTGRDGDYYDEERNTSSSSESDEEGHSMRTTDRSLFDDTTVIETVYSESQYDEEHPQRSPSRKPDGEPSGQNDPTIGSPLMAPATEEPYIEPTTSMSMNSTQDPLLVSTQLVRSNTNDLGTSCTTNLLSLVSDMLFPKVENESNQIQREAQDEVASEVSSKGWSSGSTSSQALSEPCSILQCHGQSMPETTTTVIKSKGTNGATGSILSTSIYPIAEERDDSDDKQTSADNIHNSALMPPSSSSSPPPILLERQPSVSAHSSLFSDGTDPEHQATIRSFKSMNQQDPSLSYRDEESQRTRNGIREDLLNNIHIVWAGDV